MNTAVARLILVALIALTCNAALINGSNGMPFLERIPVIDFLDQERLFDQNLSKSCDFVIYEGNNSAHWASPLAFREKSDGNYELFIAGKNDADSTPSKKASVVISAPIAKNIIKTLQRLMERKVFAPSGRSRDISNYAEDDYWIFLRPVKTQAIAGVALRASLHMNRNPHARIFHQIFCSDLRGLLAASAEDKSSILTVIDQTTAQYVMDQESDSAPVTGSK